MDSIVLQEISVEGTYDDKGDRIKIINPRYLMSYFIPSGYHSVGKNSASRALEIYVVHPLRQL